MDDLASLTRRSEELTVGTLHLGLDIRDGREGWPSGRSVHRRPLQTEDDPPAALSASDRYTSPGRSLQIGTSVPGVHSSSVHQSWTFTTDRYTSPGCSLQLGAPVPGVHSSLVHQFRVFAPARYTSHGCSDPRHTSAGCPGPRYNTPGWVLGTLVHQFRVL